MAIFMKGIYKYTVIKTQIPSNIFVWVNVTDSWGPFKSDLTSNCYQVLVFEILEMDVLYIFLLRYLYV